MSEINVDVSDYVATVAINRPHRRNSLTLESSQELYETLSKLAKDESIRVLVLRGVGKDFCCGADIHSAASRDNAGEGFRRDMRIYDVTLLLHEMKAFTIAAIRGGCAGAGFGWALACDIRVADDDVRINTAFLDVGVAGDMAGPWLLPRIVGSGRARDLYVLPRKVGSEEAYNIGLVNRVFSQDTFEDELAAIAKKIARSAPLALASLKQNFVEAERMTLSSYIALESERHERLLATDDRKEAFKAFIEKRPGVFKGA